MTKNVVNSPFIVPLLAAYPILFIAAANPGQTGWPTVALAACAAALAAALLVLALRLIFKSWARAVAGVTVIVVLFFAYGPVHTALDVRFLSSLIEGHALTTYSHPLLTALWLLAILGAVLLRRVSASRIEQLVRAVNVMTLVLLGLVTVQLASGWISKAPATAARNTRAAVQKDVSAIGYNPDIYDIVLDGYARADVLREYYGFDNSEFLNGLKQRGFEVSDASTANYSWTFLSLASLLNMDYVQPLLGERLKNTKSYAVVYDAVRDNEVGRFLRQRGYRIVHFQTTWGATRHNPYADVEIACHRGIFTDEFYRAVAEASWLKALQSKVSADLAECHLSNLEALARMGTRPGPKFVFAHFLPPHYPYLFDREGNVLQNANLSNQFEFQKRLWERKDQYIDQLVFMNNRITAAVDRILATSARPPIIVIHSDHGPNLAAGNSHEQWISIRRANFAAYLLPGKPGALMPANLSLVNQYRHIFNFYFNQRMPILPDRYYFSSFEDPYGFEEITSPSVRN
jgi:hypothetical protein